MSKGRVKVGGVAEEAAALARHAYESGAWSEAFAQYSRAAQDLKLPTAEFERWASCAGLIGRDEDFVEIYAQLYHRHLAEGALLPAARAAFWQGFRLAALGDVGKAGGWLRRAEELLDAAQIECVERGYLLLPVARRHLAAGNLDGAIEATSRAVEIGQSYGDEDLISLARTVKGSAMAHKEKLAESLGLLDQSMLSAAAGQLSSPLLTGLVYCSVIAVCQRVHAWKRAREWTRELATWCDARPDLVAFRGECAVHLSEIQELSGDWPLALKNAQLATQCEERPSSRAITASAWYRAAELHRLCGESDAAERSFERAAALGRDLQPGLGLLRARDGQIDEALGGIRRALAESKEPLSRVDLLAAAVEIFLQAQQMDDARKCCRELENIVQRADLDELTAISTEARGRCHLATGDAQGALGPLRRSYYLWQQVGAPYREARLLHLLARACAALGDHEGANKTLEQARMVFERLGAVHDLEETRQTTLSERPTHGLTARELEVLRLVSSGLKNRAIAEKLRLSEKTIDRHLSNIFVKLGVSSRTAASTFALKNHLV
jgi:DNA-binding CsgD family transcriptional regulator